MWTRTDDSEYHTPYQTDDGVVKIEVKYPSTTSSNMVYFKVVDYDDESPYESDDVGDDNYQVINNFNEFGLLINPDGVVGITQLSVTPINTGGEKIATIYLRVSDRFSGDNYKVLASLDDDFTEEVVETTNLVAWKRGYIDYRRMYEN